MRAVIGHLGWFAPYAASIALTKGMALVSIPLVTSQLAPDDYGRLELVLSFVELAGLALSFAAADVLYRLAADRGGADARACARDLTGLALSLALGMGLLLQALVYVFAHRISPLADPALLAIGLASASLSGLIELPLAWLRWQGRANLFLCFVGARSLLQIAVMWLMLDAGYGAWGLLLGNACVDAAAAALLVALQWRETGIGVNAGTARRAFRYGGPLVLGGFSMFALGACDRWFLAGAVPVGEIAFYALAGKIAWAVSLAVQPFGLWWYPRRLRVLQEENGFARSADAVLAGFGFLLCGAVGVAMLAPFAFEWVLPPAYAPALALLPALIAVAVLHETCSLMNVGAFAGSTGVPPLVVNTIGAVVAVVGYIVLVPAHGVAGAIAATIAGHLARLICFIWHGRARAAIPYRAPAMLAMGAVAAAAVASFAELAPLARMGMGACALLAIGALAASPMLMRHIRDRALLRTQAALAGKDCP